MATPIGQGPGWRHHRDRDPGTPGTSLLWLMPFQCSYELRIDASFCPMCTFRRNTILNSIPNTNANKSLTPSSRDRYIKAGMYVSMALCRANLIRGQKGKRLRQRLTFHWDSWATISASVKLFCNRRQWISLMKLWRVFRCPTATPPGGVGGGGSDTGVPGTISLTMKRVKVWACVKCLSCSFNAANILTKFTHNHQANTIQHPSSTQK